MTSVGKRKRLIHRIRGVLHDRRELLGHFSAVLQDSSLLVLIRVSGMLIGFALTIVLSRVLSPSDFGTVSVAFSLAMIVGLFTTLNLGAGALRFLTGYANNDDNAAVRAFLRCGNTLVSSFAVLIWAALGAITIASHTWQWFPSMPLHLAVGLAAAPWFGWLRVAASNVLALGSVVRAFIPNTIIRPFLMLSLVLIIYTISGQIDSTAILASYFCAAFTVCILQYPIFKNKLSPTSLVPSNIVHPERRQWIRVGLELLIPTLFLDLAVDTIIIISSLILGNSQIAILTVILRIQAVILFGVSSINISVAPRIARAHNKGDAETVNWLLCVAAHLKLWPSLLILGFLVFYGESVLNIFGTEYRSENLPLLILSLRPILVTVFGPVILLATILGLQRQAHQIFLVAIALLVVLILVCGYFFEVTGVAFAVVIVWFLWHWMLYLVVRRHCKYRVLQPRF